MLAGVWGSWCAGLAVRSAGPMSVLVQIRAKNEMCVYELPYMESVMCECLLASGRALVTPTMVWSAKNRACKRVPDPPYPPLP